MNITFKTKVRVALAIALVGAVSLFVVNMPSSKCEAAIKRLAKDPDSVTVVSFRKNHYLSSSNGRYDVYNIKYRARNGFGGMGFGNDYCEVSRDSGRAYIKRK